MAIISTAKLLLIICALVVLLNPRHSLRTSALLAGKSTPIAVLVVLCAFAVSLLWTTAPLADSLGSLAKYGKLIVIVLLPLLIRDRREALYALAAFALGQLFLLTSSWMLFAGIPVPWATSNMALTANAVFSSYLDQSIIGAVFAAVCWHLRVLVPARLTQYAICFIALMALLNVFAVLIGRSGHVVAIALLSIAVMWELPKKYRAVAIVLPFVLASGLYFGSAKVRERMTLVEREVQSYSTQLQTSTSSGVRLRFWQTSVQAIFERPLGGSGVGSWSTEYNRLQRVRNPAHQDVQGNGNPHQEYLLWGVQLGIPGIALLVFLMFSVARDSMRMEKPFARATQSVLLALSIACLFNASIYDAQIGDFFCVVLGLLLALGLSRRTVPFTATATTSKQIETV